MCENKLLGFSSPGTTQQLSILSGLNDLNSHVVDDDVVFIHDAARPLVSVKLLKDCLDAVKVHEGVTPVLPLKDTVYIGSNGRVTALLDRDQLYARQAPEAFPFGKYYCANSSLLPDKIKNVHGSTEPAFLAGMDVAIIPGDERNFKITTKADLEKFRDIVE